MSYVGKEIIRAGEMSGGECPTVGRRRRKSKVNWRCIAGNQRATISKQVAAACWLDAAAYRQRVKRGQQLLYLTRRTLTDGSEQHH